MKNRVLLLALIALLFSARAFSQTGDQITALADGMSPGTWAAVPMNSTYDGAGGVVTAGTGNSQNRFGYASQGFWDSNKHRSLITGEDDPDTYAPVMQFSQSTNNWTIVCKDANGQASDYSMAAGSLHISSAGNVQLNSSTVGMEMHIYSGTNLTPGLYLIDALAASNEVVLHTSPQTNPALPSSNGNAAIRDKGCLEAGTHGYGHSTGSSFTGDYFYKQYAVNSPAIFWKLPKGEFDPVTNPFVRIAPYTGVADSEISCNYWDGPLAGNTTDASGDYQGQIACPNANTYDIYFYSPLRDKFWDVTGQYPGGGGDGVYQSQSVYIPNTNCLVYGGGTGGGGDQNHMWKYCSRAGVAGPAVQLTDSPIKVGTQHYATIAADPVTGHVLILGMTCQAFTPGVPPGCVGTMGTSYTLVFYELDTEAFNSGSGRYGVYTQLTGPAVPAIMTQSVNVHQGIAAWGDGGGALVSMSMPDHNVSAWLSCQGQTCSFMLYKHKAPLVFTEQCALPGVFRCFDFETDNQFQHAFPPDSGNNKPYGLVERTGGSPPDFSSAVKDCTASAAGSCSLELLIPADGPVSGAAGSCCDTTMWSANMSDDLSLNFGANSDVYYQFRFMPGTGWGNYPEGEGEKFFGISQGDPNSNTWSLICQPVDIAVLDGFFPSHPGNDYAQTEQSCGGSSSHVGYYPFTPALPQSQYAPNDIAMQSARPSVFCSYNAVEHHFPGNDNCLRFARNNWMTFEIGLHFGAAGGSPGTVAAVAAGSSTPTGTPTLSNVVADSQVSAHGSGATFDVNTASDPGTCNSLNGYLQGGWFDLATTGVNSAIVTSASATFPSSIVGQTFSINTGGNFVNGNYVITGWTSAHQIALATSPTTVGTQGNGFGTGAVLWLPCYTVTANAQGASYNYNDTFTIRGTRLGGATPANDLVFTVVNINPRGAPITGIVNGLAGGFAGGPLDEFENAWWEMWGALDGQPLQRIAMLGPYAWSTQGQTVGKVYFLAQDTGRTGGGSAPASTAHFDNFIASTAFIPTPAASGSVGGGGDTTPPSVTITSPTNNAVVTGFLTATSTAADNVAVAGVTFSIDGIQIGSEVTTPPYGFTLYNLQHIKPGSHTLHALGRDTSNNTTDTTITITVKPRTNIIKRVLKP